MFVLALLMLIGGLASIVQGIPFVRLEVGWTMVIAGTVGASGGAVLLGIAAAVARLGRIERALAVRSVTERPVAAPALPEVAAPEAGLAPVRAVRSEPVMAPVLPPIPFPAAPPPVPEPRPAEPTGLDGGAALAAGAAAGLAASELRLTRAEDADPPMGTHDPAPQDPIHPDTIHREPARHEPPAPAEPYSPEPLPSEPLAPEARAMHDEVPPPPVEEPPPPPGPEARPGEAPPPEAHLPEEPPGKTVIGTYDSGGNTYTMYADGTIDAETPAGLFHFASIDELKAFRSAGGEGAARSA
ncbi:hypothetical protein DK419_01045 [Methylobacterium terrae]|uniref:DUF308 domain-containing protein n=1 Tax=Methylobacterium terrae TaxID=2202827 RepID=A0A2U8WU04_9HYPH|nr:hypothetical protein DK419_01045 [Methylobacterium terrae]